MEEKNVTLMYSEIQDGTIKITKEELYEILAQNYTLSKAANIIVNNLVPCALYYEIHKEKIEKALINLITEGFEVTENLYDTEEERFNFIVLKLFKYIDNLGV